MPETREKVRDSPVSGSAALRLHVLAAVAGVAVEVVFDAVDLYLSVRLSVIIGSVEKYITDTAWQNGWVKPVSPLKERAESVGIVGAGPAGLAAAEQLRDRIPGIVVTKQGTVLAYCEARKQQGGDWGPIDVMMRRSTDGGKTWGPMRVIAFA